jgi:hypothetical protein
VDSRSTANAEPGTDQRPEGPQSGTRKGILAGLAVVGVPLLLYWVLGLFDNTTELTPSHDGALKACMGVAGVLAVVFAGVAIRLSRGMAAWRRTAISACLALIGFIFVFLLASRAASIVEGYLDFPPSRTRTFQTLLLISRAYQTHGKGRSWDIQTMPIWSDIEITEHDYTFMLAHLPPGDSSRNPDDIWSGGYFCAQVTLQKAGNALRILHSGSEKLPEGSIVICPHDDRRMSR